MNAVDLIQRVRDLADEHDSEGDRLYYKARRNGKMAHLDRSDASEERRRAAFLRDLADGLEEVDADESAPNTVARIAKMCRG